MNDKTLIAFFDGKRTWKGFELRPYSALSAGHIELARIPLRNRIKSIDDEKGTLSVYYGIASFLFLHILPLEEIEACIWQPDLFWKKFCGFLSQHQKEEIMEAISLVIAHMDGAKAGQNWQVESTGEPLPN